MEWVAVANLLVSSISSLATVVQAHNSNSNNVSKKDVEKAKTKLDKPLKVGGKQLVDIIDESLLLTLQSKAEIEARELIRAIGATSDIAQTKKLISDANIRVCFYLEQIKIHNQNKLPTVRLNKLWESHGCKSCKDADND